MPNFGLVVDASYDPISYEQYVAPFKEYITMYDKVAESYDTLAMEANKWEKLANSSEDKALYELYKKYAEDLSAAANDLAENGLSSKTRSLLSSLRGRYASEIQPIEEAWDLREKERELQRQVLLSNPDIMFSRDASNTGLSAYMSGTPALQTYNGARLYEYTSKAIEQLAQAAREDLMENDVNSEWYEILDGLYYLKDNYKGVTADVIMQSMFDANGNIKPEANKYLNAIANGAIDLSGMRNWSNWNDIASRAYSYVNQGLWGAIGTEEEKQLSNKYYDHALKQEEAARLAAMNQTTIPINPRNIYSRVKKSEALNMYNRAVQEGYLKINEDGSWEINVDYAPIFNAFLKGNFLINEFMELYEKKHGKKITRKEASEYMKKHPKESGEIMQEYFLSKGVGDLDYDATRYTEYNYAYDSEQQKDIKDAILPLLQNTNLQAVDWDDEKSTYTLTGEELSSENLKEATILESNFSVINGVPYSVLSIQHKDGSVGTYKMPVGINRQNEDTRDLSLKYAELCRIELAKIVKDPNTINKRTGKPYTQAEIFALYSTYNNHIQNAYKAQSQIGLKYKTQNVTIPGYGY